MELLRLLVLGLVAGAFSGLLGVGGGIILVPAMVVLLGFEPKLAVGTSLAIIIPTALSGALTHLSRGNVDLRAAGLIALGAIGGAYVGAAAASVLPGNVLQRIFAVVMVVVAIRMFLGK